MASCRILVVSDAHFFDPQYFQHMVNGGRASDPPSRLATDIALGDRRANPFHALLLLARDGSVSADALICCGDLTTSADPTGMNLGWLQLHRLATELGAGEPLITAGNHDLDSRFKVSVTAPQRMLRFLDPPFPTSDTTANASYWGNGYCILDRSTDYRVVLVNTCSLHGYATEHDRQFDHGFVPEQFLTQLSDELAKRPRTAINVLVCHHHPTEIDLPAEDQSVIKNGQELLSLLSSMSPPGWVILHGHRHLPSVEYADGSTNSPIVFSAGSLAANLHLRLQGRTANQFYMIDLEGSAGAVRGRYEAWTWDQHEGAWRRGQDTPALPALGGFGYRPDPQVAAATIAALVPPHAAGSITWNAVETQLSDFRFLLPQHRRQILEHLRINHNVEWESDAHRIEVDPRLLRLGRQA